MELFKEPFIYEFVKQMWVSYVFSIASNGYRRLKYGIYLPGVLAYVVHTKMRNSCNMIKRRQSVMLE